MDFMNFNKKKQPDLDWQTVNLILERTFEANNQSGNTVPLDVLASYSNYRRERFTLQRAIVVIMLIAFMLLPLLFITPSFTVTRGEDAARGCPAYDVVIDTTVPISRVTASIGGIFMPVYEVGENTYSVRPTANGTMEITVTLKNDQSCRQNVEVTQFDTTAPVLMADKHENDILSIWVADEGLGVDYENVFAYGLGGEMTAPVGYDEAEGRIDFPYPTETVNLYIPDMVGNKLQLVVMLNTD